MSKVNEIMEKYKAGEITVEEAKPLPKTPDMRRRKDLAGQVVRQKTKSGLYDVTYDADGYAVKARRVS